MSESLTTTETTRLTELETAIETGLQTFTEVGNALLEIRDSRLYREKFSTFEKYCRTKWSMSKRHANRLIEATSIVGEMGPIGPKPTSESQVRPLAKLPPDQRKEAWEEAGMRSGGQPTAADVEAVVDEIRPRIKSADEEKAYGRESADNQEQARIDKVLDGFQAGQAAKKEKLREIERSEHTPEHFADTYAEVDFVRDVWAPMRIKLFAWLKDNPKEQPAAIKAASTLLLNLRDWRPS